MNRAKIAVVSLSIMVLLVVVLQNTQETTVRLLFAQASMPLAFLLGLMLVGGFVCGLVAALVLGRRSAQKAS